MVQRRNGRVFVGFFDRAERAMMTRFDDVLFYEAYRRSSKDETKAYIMTLFQVDDTEDGADDVLEDGQDFTHQAFTQPTAPENSEDLARLTGLLSPDYQEAFGAILNSLCKLANVAGNSEAHLGEQEGDMDGLKSDLDEHQKTIEDLSMTIEQHAKRISEHEVTIGDHEKTIQERDQVISELQAKIQELALLSRPSQLVNESLPTTNVEPSELTIRELEEKLKASDSKNKEQAQKIANMLNDPGDYKNIALIKLQSQNEEKDEKIQDLEGKLEQLQQIQQSSHLPPQVKTLDLHGLRFQDCFIKLPTEGSNASLHKERNGLKFRDENNTWWQKTRMLQDGIVIAGAPLPRVETINGDKYDCYEEKGKQKRLKYIDESSLVQHDGKVYVSWEILKETEPEEPDFSF